MLGQGQNNDTQSRKGMRKIALQCNVKQYKTMRCEEEENEKDT